MPLYSFKCQSCGHIQDAYFTLNESHLINCESCKSTNMKQYFGNANVAVHGFTEFVDPRGGTERLTMAQIKNIEKKENSEYLSHDEHDKEIAKNKKHREAMQAQKNRDIAEKATKELMNKWNH